VTRDCSESAGAAYLKLEGAGENGGGTDEVGQGGTVASQGEGSGPCASRKIDGEMTNINAVINPPVIQKCRPKIYIICLPEIVHINGLLQTGVRVTKCKVMLTLRSFH
jgi:hypothetical protein